MTSVRRSSMIRDRSRWRRRTRLVSVVGNAQQRQFCKGIDIRFSYRNIGEKADVVGYCLRFESDKMLKAMETHHGRVKCRNYESGIGGWEFLSVWKLYERIGGSICESLPSVVIEDIKTQISLPTQAMKNVAAPKRYWSRRQTNVVSTDYLFSCWHNMQLSWVLKRSCSICTMIGPIGNYSVVFMWFFFLFSFLFLSCGSVVCVPL